MVCYSIYFEKFPFSLTQDILVMLWNERGPVLQLWFLDVYVDETVQRGIHVGVEREHSSLVGDVRVLGVEVVHEFDPWQQAYTKR